ncbi:MAG: cobalamin B12-binding domain-containing protein [Pseudomonadota bacterium]
MQQQATSIPHLDETALVRARTVINTQKSKLDEDTLALMAEEVLVRLSESFETALQGPPIPDARQIDAFCQVLLRDNEAAAKEMITSVRNEGASLDTVYLGYFGQAARRLGEFWESDKVTFTDVTIATGHMYAIMRGLRHVIAPPLPNIHRHAFFASAPAETHTLGVTVAADLMRQRGWEIELQTHRTHDELVAAAMSSDHTIIGLSASHRKALPALTRLVVAMRIIKPNAFVMVSGPITEQEPNIGDIVDADCVVSNVPDAIEHMEQLIAEREALLTGK